MAEHREYCSRCGEHYTWEWDNDHWLTCEGRKKPKEVVETSYEAPRKQAEQCWMHKNGHSCYGCTNYTCLRSGDWGCKEGYRCW